MTGSQRRLCSSHTSPSTPQHSMRAHEALAGARFCPRWRRAPAGNHTHKRMKLTFWGNSEDKQRGGCETGRRSRLGSAAPGLRVPGSQLSSPLQEEPTGALLSHRVLSRRAVVWPLPGNAMRFPVVGEGPRLRDTKRLALGHTAGWEEVERGMSAFGRDSQRDSPP